MLSPLIVVIPPSLPFYPSFLPFLPIHSFIHSLMRPSVHHSSSDLHTPFFFHLSIRHLQALFVRRFFSCSCLLKARWKVIDLWPPGLTFLTNSRLVQKLLNITSVHAVNPAATHMLDNPPCVCVIYLFIYLFSAALKRFNSSQAAYCIDWLPGFSQQPQRHKTHFIVWRSSVLMHVLNTVSQRFHIAGLIIHMWHLSNLLWLQLASNIQSSYLRWHQKHLETVIASCSDLILSFLCIYAQNATSVWHSLHCVQIPTSVSISLLRWPEVVKLHYRFQL